MKRPILCSIFALIASIEIVRSNTPIEPDTLLGTLNEVEIVAHKKLVKISAGKIEYNVAEDKDAKSLTIIEMLRKVPLVTIDGNDNIMVNGSSDFVIYKNGKPFGLFAKNAKEVLNSISAQMVKRIEVITDPESKYDAEGVNGIINIIMNERAVVDGVQGMARASATTSEVYSVSGNVTTQKGPVVLNTNYGYNYYGETQTTFSCDDYTYKDSGNRLHSKSVDRMPGGAHLLGLSASWEVDSLNLLSMSVDAQLMRFKYDLQGSSIMMSSDGDVLSQFNDTYKSPPYNNSNVTARMDFQHQTHLKGEALSFSYLMNMNDSKLTGEMNYFDEIQNAILANKSYSTMSKSRQMEHTLQADYVRPLFGWGDLNIGSKYIHRNNTQKKYRNYVDGTLYQLDFEHYSHIIAMYGEFMLDRTRWAAHAGLRYEYSRMGGRYNDESAPDFHRDLNDIVPRVGGRLNLNDANLITLNYNIRIKRPSMSRLNPVESSSPTHVTRGNPKLKSANQHNFTLGYALNANRIVVNTTLRHTFIDNAFVPEQKVVDGVIYSSYGNSGHYEMTALQGFAQWTPSRSTQLTLNYGTYYQIAENEAMNLRLNRWRLSFYGQLSQRLPWQLRMSIVVGRDPGAEISPYDYQDGQFFYNIGVERGFLKDERLTAKLTAYNVFASRYQGAPTHIVNGDYIGESVTKYMSKSISLSVSYRFGTLKSRVKTTDRTIENDDLM